MTMGCVTGHRLTVSEEEGRRLNLSPCMVCHRPLFSVQVRAVASRVRGAKPVPRLCAVHENGDPCCLRQRRSA